MNRFDQLKQTIPINLKTNKKYRGKVEFILVNFIKKNDEQEGLRIDKYIRNNFKEELSNGYLKYYMTNKLENWNASKAKNTSHKYANGLLVYNLDCDNFVINLEIDQIINNYNNKDNFIYFGWSGTWKDGTAGRVCTTKKQFLELNGYNQNFNETGYEDLDLFERLKAKYKSDYYKPHNFVNTALQNDKSEGIKNINNKKSWKEMERHNHDMSKFNIKNKIFRNDHELGINALRVY